MQQVTMRLVLILGLTSTIALVPGSLPGQAKRDAGLTPRGAIDAPGEENSYFAKKQLSSDLKAVDVVAYVDVSSVRVADHVGDIDCMTNAGTGYCLYVSTAEVKELFKGKITSRAIEFYTASEGGYPKSNLLGQQVVFLLSATSKSGKRTFNSMENSSRPIQFDVLEKLRTISKRAHY